MEGKVIQGRFLKVTFKSHTFKPLDYFEKTRNQFHVKTGVFSFGIEHPSPAVHLSCFTFIKETSIGPQKS